MCLIEIYYLPLKECKKKCDNNISCHGFMYVTDEKEINACYLVNNTCKKKETVDGIDFYKKNSSFVEDKMSSNYVKISGFSSLSCSLCCCCLFFLLMIMRMIK
jgi:hypothetical protein